MANTIKIKKLEGGSISIRRDENLIHMLSVGYGIHRNILEAVSKGDGKAYSDGGVFEGIMQKIVSSGEEGKKLNETIVLSKDDTVILNEWVDCICQLLVEMDGVDYKDEKISKFLKISQDFLKKSGDKKVKSTKTKK